ncbi:MAG: transcription-repair coupling factor, partial [Dokdonella sp.]
MTATVLPARTVNQLLPVNSKQRRYWLAPQGAALALLLSDVGRRHDSIVVAVTRDTQGAHALETELAAFAGSDLEVLHFPDWETLPYDLYAPHPEIVSQRIATLYRLPGVRRGLLVVPAATLMQRLPPRSYIAGSGLVLELHQKLDIGNERRRLEAAGYRPVPQVQEPGDFAVRGALIDIYPMGSHEPYRIELFDDEIDSIRTFDPETQRSAQKVDSVRLLPGREFPLTDDSIRDFRNLLRERFPIDPRRCPIYQDLREGVTPAGIEYYLPLFFEQTQTLFDYLAPNALFVVTEGALEAADHFWEQASERYDQRAHDIERPILPVTELYLPPQQLREALNQPPRIDIVAAGASPHAINTGTQPAPMLPL